MFLDRDGVINRPVVRQGRPHPPDSIDELELYPDAAASLRELQAAGFALVVVTNQPDVARGLQRERWSTKSTAELRRQVRARGSLRLLSRRRRRMRCRKPAPGLLFDAADDLGLDLGRSFMVGDRWRDVEAGRRAGCRTVLIDRQLLRTPRPGPGRRARRALPRR